MRMAGDHISFPRILSKVLVSVVDWFDAMNKVARLSFLLLLAITLALSTSLAFASPPDPAWVQGIYDESDFDNIVDLISASAGVVDLYPVDYRRLAPLVIAVLSEMYERAVPSEGFALIQPRAPPQI